MEKKIAREYISTSASTELPPRVQNSSDSVPLSQLISVLEKKLTPKQLLEVKEIGLAIGSVGLSLEDACLRSRVNREDLDNLMIHIPEIATYLKLKKVEYKYKLLQTVTKQATENGDVKIAMWLLEKHYADEYDSSTRKDLAKMGRENQGDMVEMAFAYIRRQNSNTMPVNENAGNAEDRSAVKSFTMDEILK